jgi:hypothetical protein
LSKLKTGTAIIVLLVIVSQIGDQYALGRAGHSQGVAESKLPPNDAMLNLNAEGEVPGNPQAEVATLHKLAQALSAYRTLHGGASAPSGTQLLLDMARHLSEYGYHSFQQVTTLFFNPDAKFADDPEARAYPKSYQAFTLPQTRPDGSSKNQSKPLGTQDVEAYTNLYYHQNIKHGAGDRTTSHPAGFYLVLWASGQVEAIPYRKVYYVPDGPGDYILAFPGEAGVPKNALTYQQLYPKS